MTRDTIDLRIAKGLRKPCYSTHTDTSSNSIDYAAVSTRSHGISDLEVEQHSCPIVQVRQAESLLTHTTVVPYCPALCVLVPAQVDAVSGTSTSGDGASGLSQFVSLETSGKAIIWAATYATTSKAGDNIDYGLSPWGKIKLVRQRVLFGSTGTIPRQCLYISNHF